MICKYCAQDTDDKHVRTCYADSVGFSDGVVLEAIPFEAPPLASFEPPADWAARSPLPEEARCPGCGVASGAWHHVRCPCDTCPRCLTPSAGCPCQSV